MSDTHSVPGDPALRAALRTLIIGVLALVLLVFAVSLWLRDPLEAAAGDLIERFGYVGIGVGVWTADCLTFPLPADVYLLLGIAAGADPAWVIVAASIGSIVGGLGAFGIGLWFGRTRFVSSRVGRFRERYGKLVERSGLVAVIVAALTPVPFSIVCYVAGSLRLRFLSFALATLFRIPRIAGYYYVIYVGWTA